jgi:hypothetical protein
MTQILTTQAELRGLIEQQQQHLQQHSNLVGSASSLLHAQSFPAESISASIRPAQSDGSVDSTLQQQQMVDSRFLSSPPESEISSSRPTTSFTPTQLAPVVLHSSEESVQSEFPLSSELVLRWLLSAI